MLVNTSPSARIYRAETRLDRNVTGWWKCSGDNGQETNLKGTVQGNVITVPDHFIFSGSREQNRTEVMTYDRCFWLSICLKMFLTLQFREKPAEVGKATSGDRCVCGGSPDCWPWGDPELRQEGEFNSPRQSVMPTELAPSNMIHFYWIWLQIEMPEARGKNRVCFLCFCNQSSTNTSFLFTVRWVKKDSWLLWSATYTGWRA